MLTKSNLSFLSLSPQPGSVMPDLTHHWVRQREAEEVDTMRSRDRRRRWPKLGHEGFSFRVDQPNPRFDPTKHSGLRLEVFGGRFLVGRGRGTCGGRGTGEGVRLHLLVVSAGGGVACSGRVAREKIRPNPPYSAADVHCRLLAIEGAGGSDLLGIIEEVQTNLWVQEGP